MTQARNPAALALLVLLAHGLLAWGLWSQVLTLPVGVAQPAAAWPVVVARVVPAQALQPPPVVPDAAAPERRLPLPLPAARAAAAAPATAQLAAEPVAAAPGPEPVPLTSDAMPVPMSIPGPTVGLTAPARRTAPDHTACGPAPYPALLHERGVEGVLRLRVHVSAEGRATQVQLLASSGFRLFDEAALAQARSCRFSPARLGGEAVDEWVEYPVRFALHG